MRIQTVHKILMRRNIRQENAHRVTEAATEKSYVKIYAHYAHYAHLPLVSFPLLKTGSGVRRNDYGHFHSAHRASISTGQEFVDTHAT